MGDDHLGVVISMPTVAMLVGSMAVFVHLGRNGTFNVVGAVPSEQMGRPAGQTATEPSI